MLSPTVLNYLFLFTFSLKSFQQDDDRAKRLARLERLHFGQEEIDDEQQDNEVSPQRESTESSVEGKGGKGMWS